MHRFLRLRSESKESRASVRYTVRHADAFSRSAKQPDKFAELLGKCLPPVPLTARYLTTMQLAAWRRSSRAGRAARRDRRAIGEFGTRSRGYGVVCWIFGSALLLMGRMEVRF
jgi:hypothetical protein